MNNFIKLADGSYADMGSFSYISGNVVDDTKDFGIIATIPPTPPPVPPVTPPPPETCASQTTEPSCLALGCFWYDGACHSEQQPAKCELQITEPACKSLGCFWYDGKCHSKAKAEIPWTMIAIAVGGVITVIGLLLALRKR